LARDQRFSSDKLNDYFHAKGRQNQWQAYLELVRPPKSGDGDLPTFRRICGSQLTNAKALWLVIATIGLAAALF